MSLPDLKLQQLRYFALVAEIKSYHGAAEQAGRTQPALSLAIRELEQRLGEPLFERGNKTALTPFGQDCYPLVRALLDHYDRVVERMALAADRSVGRVALACLPSVASQMLPPALAAFAQHYPGIHVSVEDDIAYNVQQRVLQRSVDLGIADLWSLDPQLRFAPLLKDQLGLVCRHDHPLAQYRRGLEWSALQAHTLIRNDTVRLLESTQARDLMATAQFSVSNMASLLAMLREGLGVTTLPRLVVPEDDPDLVFVALAEPRVEREIGIITPKSHSLSPATKAMREALLQHFAAGAE
ncbi:MAG: LysR substrate-binding domain-containing protein [Halofilum sp. (in: g-proteobacteria)]